MAKQTIYDEVEIEDFVWDPVARVFHFPCPCGDRFEISKLMLKDGEDIAICPSCSLIIRVIFDPLEWEDYEDSDEEEEEAGSVGSGSSSPASSTVSFHSAKDEEEQVVLEQKEGEIEHISKGLGLVGLGAA